MNKIDDKEEYDNKKIIYLNNKIFEERMKKYSEKISKSDYEYLEGRVQNIKDYKKEQNEKNKKIDIEKNTDIINKDIEENKKINYRNSELAFKFRKIKRMTTKVGIILIILYISPFLVNAFTDSGINIFISLGIVITLIYASIMFISII